LVIEHGGDGGTIAEQLSPVFNFSIAGFEVTLYGRIWVTPKVLDSRV
jgi:hypothetical protein